VRHLYFIVAILFLFTACTNNKEISIPKSNNANIKTNSSSYTYVNPTPINTDFDGINDNEDFKVAIVFPSKVVGKYGNTTINSVIGYLLFQNKKFEIVSFDSEDESIDNIYNTLNEVKSKGYKKVIALFTNNSLSTVNNISLMNNMEVYFPLIAKSESNYQNATNFIYGSISYEDQMKKLLELSTENNAQFYEDSSIGYKLKNIYEKLTPEIVVNQMILRSNNNFKNIVTNERLKHTNLMLNTTIVKSSIILSQLYAYETENGAILTTQLNFDPLIISLTQYEDRLNLIFANSIEETDERLVELLNLLDTDVRYNWVNYSTLVGIDYLFGKNSQGLIKNKIINNEVIYNTYLYYSTQSSFKKLDLN
jgi:hypothetical protein